MGVTITSSSGNIQSVELEVEDFQPTVGDCLYAAQIQRSRLLRRTEAGTDFRGAPFAPYSTKGPFYFYPNGAAGKTRTPKETKNAKAGVRRFANKVGRSKLAITRSGLGIRFESYADFKQTYLGRENVDLRGPRAPHMLQEIVCRAGSLESTGGDLSQQTDESPGDSFTIGIYGEAALRASGINSEDRPKGMPRRQFIGSSDEDNRYLSTVLAARARDRAQKKLRG